MEEPSPVSIASQDQTTTYGSTSSALFQLIAIVVDYIRYPFLCLFVICMAAVFIVIVGATKPESGLFLLFNSFLLLLLHLKGSSFSFDFSDVVEWIGITSLVLWVIGSLFKYIIFKNAKFFTHPRRSRRLLIGIVIIITAFLVAMIISPWISYSPGSDAEGMPATLAFFAAFALISYTVYTLLGWVSDYIRNIPRKVNAGGV